MKNYTLFWKKLIKIKGILEETIGGSQLASKL
jgi:hypothetical protein